MNENKNNISITNIRTKLKKKLYIKTYLKTTPFLTYKGLHQFICFFVFFTIFTEYCVCVDLRQIKMIFFI